MLRLARGGRERPAIDDGGFVYSPGLLSPPTHTHKPPPPLHNSSTSFFFFLNEMRMSFWIRNEGVGGGEGKGGERN